MPNSIVDIEKIIGAVNDLEKMFDSAAGQNNVRGQIDLFAPLWADLCRGAIIVAQDFARGLHYVSLDSSKTQKPKFDEDEKTNDDEVIDPEDLIKLVDKQITSLNKADSDVSGLVEVYSYPATTTRDEITERIKTLQLQKENFAKQIETVSGLPVNDADAIEISKTLGKIIRSAGLIDEQLKALNYAQTIIEGVIALLEKRTLAPKELCEALKFEADHFLPNAPAQNRPKTVHAVSGPRSGALDIAKG